MPVTSRYAVLSIAAALLTMALKFAAWKITGSVGLLSDAMESFVNLGAALTAFTLLWVAAQPPDAGHAYGHGKAEYFAGVFEGVLIVFAATAILWAALPRLVHPQPLQHSLPGLSVTALAAAVNGGVSWVLRRAGERLHSVALRADAAHLMGDVWTSVALIVGVGLVALTDWYVLDPLLAIAAAAWILWTGIHLVRESTSGLMDAAWPEDALARLHAELDRHRAPGIDFHAIRTRRSGPLNFVSMHVLVPGEWSVQRAHDFVETVEAGIAAQFSPVSVLTHLEPIEDPLAHHDLDLGRPPPDPAAGDLHETRG